LKKFQQTLIEKSSLHFTLCRERSFPVVVHLVNFSSSDPDRIFFAGPCLNIFHQILIFIFHRDPDPGQKPDPHRSDPDLKFSTGL